MKRLLKRVSCVMLAVVSVSTFLGCGSKTEAVITTEEEITEATKEYETLSESTKEKFTYSDLTVGKVRYLMTEDEVVAILGSPVSVYDSSEKNVTENVMAEKIYSYNDLTIIFSQIDEQYLVTAAASVSDQDIFARGLKVGDSVDTILTQYYRDSDCMNHYWYSDDRSAVLGKYLYGNFTMDQIDTVKTKEKISYGLINYNGYDSVETAESYMMEFTYFEPPYVNETASIQDAFCQLAFDIDNNGIITSIRWYYYPVEQ